MASQFPALLVLRCLQHSISKQIFAALMTPLTKPTQVALNEFPIEHTQWPTKTNVANSSTK